MTDHKFPYKWHLKNGYPAKDINYHGSKVFGTFVCGGGSTMGYKLAGFKHIGGVEIDEKIATVYKENHNPNYFFTEDIRLFNKREDLPSDLYNLDLLDGSPPCSSFSMAGNRDKDWGKKKKFKEGQKMQRLDDLVFEYIKTIKKLQPKVAILENVKGLIQGNAKAYTKKIFQEFRAAGYRVQLFLLNAASMGVPQKRERVFFIGLRNDFKLPKLELSFNEKPILFGEIEDVTDLNEVKNKDTRTYKGWTLSKSGQTFADGINDGGSMFGYTKVNRNDVVKTVVSSDGTYEWHDKLFRKLNNLELLQVGSYPLDYNFKDVKPKYLIGMSVPPVMTAQISNQIYLQWLKHIK
jgi:DNA (cytosine-5)-methyltransferase 1